MRRPCLVYRCGTIPYRQAWQWQQELIRARFQNNNLPDIVLSVQHPNVYTLGRGASLDHVKFDPKTSSAELLKVDRGGEVTFHGPGQLILYPILNLRYHTQDLHWYLRKVEQVVIDTCQHYDLSADRKKGMTGVWLHEKKIAAVGVHASKWITMHGFALNVTTDLSGFDRIVPCGISDFKVDKMENHLPHIEIAQVESVAVDSLARLFELELEERSSCELTNTIV